MNIHKRRFTYIFFDLAMSAVVWSFFFIFRKKILEPEKFGEAIPLEFDGNYVWGVCLIPFLWVFLYALGGFYYDILKKSRLKELAMSILYTLIGTLILFFAVMLDDQVANYTYYYQSFSFYFVFQLLATYIPRVLITSNTNKLIQQGIIGFNTLIVGTGKRALDLTEELSREKVKNGNRIVGFCSFSNENFNPAIADYPVLGQIDELHQIISNNKIEEVILASEKGEEKEAQQAINKLHEYDITIKTIPDLRAILSGSVRMTAIFGTPLIQVSHVVMPVWQQTIKRLADIIISAIALFFLSPFLLVIALLIKRNDKGPVFYKQERIGWRAKPFHIIKFRTMKMNAEAAGPALSSENDPRITSIGKILRKYRIDEFPQFYNVLRGDMSLVGPRPERQFFIDQIVRKAPHYKFLHKVRPGITSWGMVKYGYAENVDEMVKRMRFDILYIENMSLILDMKILIYTVITVLKGRGK